jgi:hypothetical protein
MKKLLTTILTILTTLIYTPVLASTLAGRDDHSGILVWGFLGFCAVIVVAELIPSILMLLGIFNSFKETEVKPNFEKK